MFSDCENLNTVDLSSFDTKKVNNMNYMFYNCKNLDKLDLSFFNTESLKYMNYMFNKCNNLKNTAFSAHEPNEIDIIIKIENIGIKCNIYFLGHPNKNNLKELNENNTEIYINNKRKEYKKYFKPRTEGEYNIKIKFKINLTDCSYMFAGCKNITQIDFLSFNTEHITTMKYMFYKCENLKYINLLSFNTKNVTDMSYMFSNCENLINIDFSSFNTKNVKDMSHMFEICWCLNYLDLSSFDTKNVINMN